MLWVHSMRSFNSSMTDISLHNALPYIQVSRRQTFTLGSLSICTLPNHFPITIPQQLISLPSSLLWHHVKPKSVHFFYAATSTSSKTIWTISFIMPNLPIKETEEKKALVFISNNIDLSTLNHQLLCMCKGILHINGNPYIYKALSSTPKLC